MSIYKFSIQYFADEADVNINETGEKASLDAEEKKELQKPSFDELVRGDYRREYGQRVEEIVKNRIKDHHELKKNLEGITNALNGLKNELEIEADDPNEIISQIKKHIFKESKNFDAEGANSRTEQKEGSAAFDDDSKIKMAKLIQGCEITKEYYPQFEMKKELADPAFRQMLKLTDNDPKKAFEILHHDEIMASVIRDTARITEERLSGSIASRASRPAEGAQSAVNAVYINQDPKSLSKADRADIKRRVRRGERIVW